MSSVFSIKGRIDTLGHSLIDPLGSAYSTIDLIEPSGRRVRLLKVIVGTLGTPCIYPGAEGEFFLDNMRMFGFIRPKYCFAAHLNDGNNFFDKTNPRFRIGLCLFVLGIPLSIVFIGLFMMLYGCILMIKGDAANSQRRKLFYGDPSRVQALQHQTVVEI